MNSKKVVQKSILAGLSLFLISCGASTNLPQSVKQVPNAVKNEQYAEAAQVLNSLRLQSISDGEVRTAVHLVRANIVNQVNLTEAVNNAIQTFNNAGSDDASQLQVFQAFQKVAATYTTFVQTQEKVLDNPNIDVKVKRASTDYHAATCAHIGKQWNQMNEYSMRNNQSIILKGLASSLQAIQHVGPHHNLTYIN